MKRHLNSDIEKCVFDKKMGAMEANLLDFKATVEASVSRLIVKLNDKNLPSGTVNEIMAQLQTFISTMIEGIKTAVGPRIEVGKESIFNDFISRVESSVRAQLELVNNVEGAGK